MEDLSIIEMAQQIKYENQRHEAILVDIPEWTIFEVPPLVRAKSPTSFQNKGIELGLHRRTLKKSQVEVFKIDLARIVHSKLVNRNTSWDGFAHLVLGDVSTARRAYGASSARFTDEEVQNLLTLDALFLVVFWKFVNGGEFFWKEFQPIAGRLKELVSGIDKTDFFLLENQVPMYLLQSVIRQLSQGTCVAFPVCLRGKLAEIPCVRNVRISSFLCSGPPRFGPALVSAKVKVKVEVEVEVLANSRMGHFRGFPTGECKL
jgi:hypothetical protein